ncbi:hypothetical protein [Candidatus Halobonum tyrrellensis]|uniref:Periplasmic copper-binding protein n=1 Tax=Candidatus Halobonum tyrrellensis G22 TaxID=1324957 RepID=V4J210_9EURY|nr:hypothetical protein [Candidatus Halobonum tyrrellensis]ESP89457.1 periplasmic copper-binding protein [Candidatus Halobonum tyrrellensis G22]
MALNTNPTDGRGVLAVAVTALLVASTVAAGASLAAVGTVSAETTQVNSCTVLDSAGAYELTGDLSSSDPDAPACIRITASDVTLDGNGHTVESGSSTVVAGGADSLTNVTVRDLRAVVTYDNTDPNVAFDVSDGSLLNVTAYGPGGGLNSAYVTVDGDDNVVGNSSIGTLVVTGDDNRVVDSRTGGTEYLALSVDGDGNLVENVTSDGWPAVRVSGVGNRVVDGSFTAPNFGGSYGVVEIVDARDTLFANNTVESDQPSFPSVYLDGTTNTTLRGNAIEGEVFDTTTYQVDFVAGDPIENLSTDRLYAGEDRLMRFAFGSAEEGITEKDTAWPNESIRSAVDYGHITEHDDGTASVTFTVADGENVTLSLVTYSMPGEEFSMGTVDQQELLDATTETYGPGEHTITVSLPDDADGSESDE